MSLAVWIITYNAQHKVILGRDTGDQNEQQQRDLFKSIVLVAEIVGRQF